MLGLPRRVETASDDAADVKRADAVRDFIVKADDFNPLLAMLLDALGKGYSAVELVWNTASAPWTPDYVWRDPRFFRYDPTGQTLHLLTTTWGDGEPLPPYCFIVHQPRLKMGLPIRGGLARLAAITDLCRHLTVESWLAYAESYGPPV